MNKTKNIALILGVLIMSMTASYLVFGDSPVANPPEGNVPAPLNVGTIAQTKAGDLGVGGELSVAGNVIANALGVIGGFSVANDTLAVDAVNKRVGIGTTNPEKSLHVKTAAGSNAEIAIQSGSKGKWGIYHDETSEQLRFWNGDNKLVITNTGHVGIGTNAPSANLEIGLDSTVACITPASCCGMGGCYGTSVNNIIDGDFNTYWYPGDYRARAKITYSNVISGNYQIMYKWGGDGNHPNCAGTISISSDDSNWTNIVNQGASATQTYSGNTPFKYLKVEVPPSGNCGWVYISEVKVLQNSLNLLSVAGNLVVDGNVGIGTTAPGYKLDISDTESAAMIRLENKNASRKYTGLRLDRNGLAEKWFIGMNNSDDKLRIRATGATDVLTIDSSTGNVGIGTTTPSAKLTVVADANTGAGKDFEICKNGVCCPIWKDCDLDGKTWGSGDCDESCVTCFVGGTGLTTADGKDQDCNGLVDDIKEVPILNSASGLSCNAKCAQLNMSCVVIYTTLVGIRDNWSYWGRDATGDACRWNAGDCTTLMSADNTICNNIAAQYTTCGCADLALLR